MKHDQDSHSLPVYGDFGHEEWPGEESVGTPSPVLQAGLTQASLDKTVAGAHSFHARFLKTASYGSSGLHIAKMPEWGAKLIRRSGGVPEAVLEKLGSNTLCKRRAELPHPFLAAIRERYDEKAPLQLRIVVGPVKNVLRYGANQLPDLAEYLMFIQLARAIAAIAPLYPYGVRVQMIPDDMRGKIANDWPEAYSRRYIAALRHMAAELQFDAWLQVEDGQARLYDLYNVNRYLIVAKEDVISDPNYSVTLTKACLKAKENLVRPDGTRATATAVRDSAMRYLVSHRAEILSGMWSPGETLPLTYANHPGNYQLFTMGAGLTKLPWQISLPFESSTLMHAPSRCAQPALATT